MKVTYRGVTYDTNRKRTFKPHQEKLTYRGVKLEKEVK